MRFSPIAKDRVPFSKSLLRFLQDRDSPRSLRAWLRHSNPILNVKTKISPQGCCFCLVPRTGFFESPIFASQIRRPQLVRFVTKRTPFVRTPSSYQNKYPATRAEYLFSAKDRVRTCVGLRRGFYRPEYLTTLPPWHISILLGADTGDRTQRLGLTKTALSLVSYVGIQTSYILPHQTPFPNLFHNVFL